MKKLFLKKSYLIFICIITVLFFVIGFSYNSENIIHADSAQYIYEEDFSKDSLDLNKWTIDTKNGSVEIKDGKLFINKTSLTNNAIAKFNMPFKNFEIYFDMSDVNAKHLHNAANSTEYGTGTAFCFGNNYKFYMGATNNPAYNTITQFQTQANFLVKNAYGEGFGDSIYNDWLCVPMCASVKLVVNNGTFAGYVKNSQDSYSLLSWWNKAIDLGSDYKGGSIGFGFNYNVNGTFAIDNLKIVDLDAYTDCISDYGSVYSFNSDSIQISHTITDISTISEVYVGDIKCESDDFAVTTNALTINKSVLERAYLSNISETSLNIKVVFADYSYGLASIYVTSPEYQICFKDGDSVLATLSAKLGAKLSGSIPLIPEGKIGWYYNGKKINLENETVQGDAEFVVYPIDHKFDVVINYQNIWGESQTKNVKLQYNSTSDDFGVNVIDPYAGKFLGWDINGDNIVDEDVRITENCTVTGIYRKLNPNPADFLIDFDGEVNENYVQLVDTFYPGGYASMDEGFLDFYFPMSGAGLYTKQMYKDFEMQFDIKKLENVLLRDNFFYITFGERTVGKKQYYQHEYSIVFQYDGTPGNFGTVFFVLKGQTIISSGLLTKNMFLNQSCFAENTNLKHDIKSGESEPAEYWCNPGFNENFYYQIKIKVIDKNLYLLYKYNTDEEWVEKKIATLSDDVTGYVGIGPSFDHFTWHYYNHMSLGIDNFKISNFNGEPEVGAEAEGLQKNENNRYSFSMGDNETIKINLNLRAQEIMGFNIKIYDGESNIVSDSLIENLILEEAFEISDHITLNVLTINGILSKYNDCAINGKIDFDITMLTSYDCVVLPFTADLGNVAITCYNGDKVEKEYSAKYGETITLENAVATQEGYDFSHWVDESGNVYNDSIVALNKLKLTAVFKRKSFTVQFIAKDGTVFDTQTVYYGDKATIPSIEPIDIYGSEFVGWEGIDDPIYSDCEIQSKWKGGSGKSGCNSNIKSNSICFSLIAVVLAMFVVYKKEKN